jgi:hypothetical protein
MDDPELGGHKSSLVVVHFLSGNKHFHEPISGLFIVASLTLKIKLISKVQTLLHLR